MKKDLGNIKKLVFGCNEKDNPPKKLVPLLKGMPPSTYPLDDLLLEFGLSQWSDLLLVYRITITLVVISSRFSCVLRARDSGGGYFRLPGYGADFQ